MGKTWNRLPRISLCREISPYLLCALVAVGCAGPREGGTPSVAAMMPGYPGSDPAKTKDYLERHVTFDRNHPRDSIYDGLVPCDYAPKCGSATEVNLRITPEKNAHTRRTDANFFASTTGGYFLAKIVNNDGGHRRYGTFDLTWNDSVYMWAGPLPDGTRRIGVFHIAADGSANMVAVAQGAGYCPPQTSATRTISAFHLHGEPYCTVNPIYPLKTGEREGTIVRLASNPLIAPRSLTAAAMLHTTGLWYSCQMGCCEAQQTN